MATSTDINTYFPDVSPAASKIAGSCDLLSEILSRVPLRSLFRFKCVSRNWRCLISDDRRFALLHSKRNPKGSCSGLFSLTSSTLASKLTEAKERKYDFILLSDRPRFAPPPPALSFLESLSCSRILQSSNGLLLCSSSSSNCAYFVCNLVRGQFRRLDLPDEVGRKRNWMVLGLTLAFDASRWSGFKVICCMSRAIDVYSSDTGNWKRLVEGPIQELNMVLEDGAYWNGKAFWLRKQSTNFLQIDSPPTYRVLNLENESFTEHNLPCTYSMVYYFGESMGHLHLVIKDHEAFNLFEMGENQEWMLKCKVMEDVMRKRLTGGYFAVSNFVWGGCWVLGVVRKPEQRALQEDGYLVLWYLSYGEGRVVSYNCKTGVVSCLSESKPPGTMQEIQPRRCLEFHDPTASDLDNELTESLHSKIPKDIIPRVGMEFETEEAAYEFYNAYALVVGFSVRKSYFHKLNGVLIDRVFVCSSQGKREPDKRDDVYKAHRPETRFGCLAMLKISCRYTSRYSVEKFIVEHNHVLASPRKAHLFRSHRNISVAQALQVDMADSSGIAPRNAYEFMARQAGGREKLGFSKVDVNNYLRSKRSLEMVSGDTGGVLEFLQSMKEEDPGFFYAIQVDEDDLITNIFWTDAKMIADFEDFGDVVCFDTTYRKFKDGRPIALFVGVNHHKQSTIFGAALLYDETANSFIWLFDTFSRAMGGKLPQTILTDQDAAMAKALAFQWPDTYHRLCIWHIFQNAAIHLKDIFKDYKDFSRDSVTAFMTMSMRRIFWMLGEKCLISMNCRIMIGWRECSISKKSGH